MRQYAPSSRSSRYRGSRPFGQDALLRVSAIADPRAAMARPHGREPVTVEAANPGGDGLGVPSSDLVSRRRVAGPISNGQQGSSAVNLGGGSAKGLSPNNRVRWNRIEHRLFAFITQNWR